MNNREAILLEHWRQHGFAGIDDSLNSELAAQIVSEPKIQTIQTNGPLKETTWQLINEEILSNRADIFVRIFGYYSGVCDLSFLTTMTNLVNLKIGDIGDSDNIEVISELAGLKRLRISVYDLTSFQFLEVFKNQLTTLSLGRTKSRRPDLKILDGFTELQSLSLKGHSKNIDVVGGLNSLSDFGLSGVTLEDFNFVHNLEKLEDFSIDLVSCENFRSIENLRIKSFGMSEIRKLVDIDFISKFPRLQNLSLSDLNNVTNFGFKPGSKDIRRIFLDNMKSTTNIDFVFACENLVDLVFRGCSTKLLPKDFLALSKLEKLKYATIGTGGAKKNQEISEFLTSCGIEPYSHYEFVHS